VPEAAHGGSRQRSRGGRLERVAAQPAGAPRRLAGRVRPTGSPTRQLPWRPHSGEGFAGSPGSHRRRARRAGPRLAAGFVTAPTSTGRAMDC